MAYFTRAGFVADPFAGHEFIDGANWPERRGTALPSPTNLRLQPGFDVETLASELRAIGLIAIAFPKFTDGRGYSMGWLLRTRLGFKGEMRAIGDVLFDEMQLMSRCGFDTFEIVDPATLRLLEKGRRPGGFDRFYQPGLEPEVPAGTRPWARRSA